MPNEALVIFAKNPELGKAKTRLAQSVGDKVALKIYKKLLAYTQRQTNRAGVDLIVYYTDHIEENDGWTNAKKKMQVEGDLGEKMAAAFQNEFQSYEKVCIIGTDCAELTENHVLEAFELLKNCDFVLGPANDGGYYLLGMNRLYTELFMDIEWSTENVLKQTKEVINNLNKTYKLLPELIDVDTIEDWEKVKENFK